MDDVIKERQSPWEPAFYGFCAYNETDNVKMAMTLEALRRSVCAYGGAGICDCKYGLTVDPNEEFKQRSRTSRFSEQTGCPELREMIHRLLHRNEKSKEIL